MENLKTKICENKKFILISLLLILLTSIAIIFIYNYKYENKDFTHDSSPFDNIIGEVNLINNSIKDCPTEFTISSEIIVDTLRDNIDSLEKQKKYLHAMIILDDYTRDVSSKILSSIESTQNLYNYCISSLEYQNLSYISDSIKKINEEEFDLLESYVELNTLGIELEFNNDALMFFDKLVNHLTTLESLTKKNKISLSQSDEFIKNFRNSVSDLSVLVQDLEPAITKVRDDNRSFDSILNDINDKESKYLTIKNNFNSISIPDGYLSYYNSLIDTFNLYSNYLKTLRIAIIFEKSSTSYDDNKKDIDKNYKNAYSKFDDVNDSLKSLEKSIENF